MTHDTSSGSTLEEQFENWFDSHVSLSFNEAKIDYSKIEAGETGYYYHQNGVAIKIPAIFNSLFGK